MGHPRRNELVHYSKDVVEALERLVKESGAERIVLLGSQEALGELESALPEALRDKVVGRETAVDLAAPPEELIEVAREMSVEEERREEQELWERVRSEGLAGGLAAFGPKEVLAALQEGRVDAVLVGRDARIRGMRCRDCELLAAAKPQQCPACKSSSVFEVDLVDEIVSLAERTSADVEFTDTFAALDDAGGVAALLRY